MLTVMFILAASAFICTVVSALGKCPVWVPLVLLCIIAMLQVAPLK